MTSATNADEELRAAALSALRSWASRRERMPSDRARLLAVAWNAGERNVRRLAQAAGISRDTVYADLKSQKIDPTDRSPSRRPGEQPHFAPMDPDDVREAADAAAAVLLPAMLTSTPAPLAAAAWQTSIALAAVAELIDPAPGENHDRMNTLDDLAARGDSVRSYAHQAMAAEKQPSELAAWTENHWSNVYDVQAVVSELTVTLMCPDTGHITVKIGTGGRGEPVPGWTTWTVTGGSHELGPLDAHTHLEIQAALRVLSEAITAALPEEALTEQ